TKRERTGHPPLHAKGVELNGSRRSPGLRLAYCVRPSRLHSGPNAINRRLQLRGSVGFPPTSRTREPKLRKNKKQELDCKCVGGVCQCWPIPLLALNGPDSTSIAAYVVES